MRAWMGFLAVALIGAGACRSAGKEQAIFEFHSGFWVNLHQFLCHEATAKDPARSDSPQWQAAVDYYRREVVTHNEKSHELTDVNNRLSAAGSAAELPVEGLDPDLAASLAKAAAIYRAGWWPEHNRSNLAWIDAVRPLIEKYGAAIQKGIATAYRIDWPAAPIRTDVSAYASAYGAYTTTSPAHITISSTDASYQGMASLEMLFHEASHTLDEKLDAALAQELGARGKLFRRRGFEHAIIFYTAGEITRRSVAGYEPCGIKNGVMERGWPGGLAVLEKDWKPYLEGQIDLAAAVEAVVADYGVAKKAQ